MILREIYPFFPKVQSSLINVLDNLSSDEISSVHPLLHYSINGCITKLCDYYLNWFFSPVSDINVFDFAPYFSTFSPVEKLSTLFQILEDQIIGIDRIVLDRYYNISYQRGSVEVVGKFSGSYLLWSIIEYTIHVRCEIHLILKSMDMSFPELLH